jgi:hypothetical protein
VLGFLKGGPQYLQRVLQDEMSSGKRSGNASSSSSTTRDEIKISSSTPAMNSAINANAGLEGPSTREDAHYMDGVIGDLLRAARRMKNHEVTRVVRRI